jgi:hypothetical protein
LIQSVVCDLTFFYDFALNLKIKTMKKIYFFLSLLGLLTLQMSWAQQKTVTGNVVDEFGLPLPGATVVFEGTDRGVATDFDGNFSIDVGNDQTLIITYLGYAPQRVIVGNQDNLVIQMNPGNELEEVIVTSLCIKREKQALGYAISEVDNASIEQRAEGDIG